MFRPHGNRGRADQDAGVGRHDEACGSRENRGCVADELDRQMRSLSHFVGEERCRRERAECGQRPGADGHRTLNFENAQHVEKSLGTAEVRDEERAGKEGARACDPSRVVDEIAIGARDLRCRPHHRRRPRRPAHEKVRRHFPRPHRLLEQWHPVVAAVGFDGDGVAAQFFEAVFGDHFLPPNANASSDPTAIAAAPIAAAFHAGLNKVVGTTGSGGRL